MYRKYHVEGRKDLVVELFFKRKKRHKLVNINRNRIIDYGKKNIRECPEAANAWSEIGHMEGDLIESAHKDSYLLTLVDRCSNYTMGLLLPSKDKETVKRGINENINRMYRYVPPKKDLPT